MIEVCEGECVSAVCVIYYPKAQLMIFQPQDRDYTSESRQNHDNHLISYRPYSKYIANKFYWHIFIDLLKTTIRHYPNKK